MALAASKFQDPFALLDSQPIPRQFAWETFIKQRRVAYNLGSLALLGICVGIPLLVFITRMKDQVVGDQMRPNQIALYFGALVVVAFVRYSYVLHKLWDDSKWLARYGRLQEANLLWVIAGPNRLIVTYRFWTVDGVEILKDTVIDADGRRPLAELAAGDVVPLLYDPRSPRRRSMLWAEIERYVVSSVRPAKMRSAEAEAALSTGRRRSRHATTPR